jgi:endo-1,4-beta-D-glucanase Y
MVEGMALTHSLIVSAFAIACLAGCGSSKGPTLAAQGGVRNTGGFATGGTSEPSGGSDASGGKSGGSGGSSRGGAGNGGSSSVSGGSSSGGGTHATGGGGASSGGTQSGGSATGGTSAGGTSTGGAPAGGASTGGAETGGTEPVCTNAAGSLKAPYAFPQNFKSSRCHYPTKTCSEDAQVAYDQWKQELVTSDGAGGFRRVRRPDNESGGTDTTVSEGIGYGMILAVFMDDQSLFDDLWKYSQTHLDGKGLMIWLIQADGQPGVEDSGSGRRASGSATDADEDMAWALAQAAQKWGGNGSLNDSYANIARAMMGRMLGSELDTRFNLFNAGDSWGETFAWNPSYFAPSEYRTFAKLDTEHTETWNGLIDKGYEVLAASQDKSTGLVPAWSDASGAPNAPSGMPTHYQYDSARVPFRIALDYCDNGESRAQAILAKLTTFFSGIGADKIVDGYELNGTPKAENTSPEGVQSALFVGAAGVGAMSTTNQDFIDGVYLRLVEQPDELMLPKSRYFNLSWKVFTLLMMSGNLFDYTQHP